MSALDLLSDATELLQPMKSIKSIRVKAFFVSLPGAYNLAPAGDYQVMVSHSAADLSAKAWSRTGEQMARAISTFEQKNPDVRRKLAKAA